MLGRRFRGDVRGMVRGLLRSGRGQSIHQFRELERQEGRRFFRGVDDVAIGQVVGR